MKIKRKKEIQVSQLDKLEHPRQWSYFFSYLAPQKATLSILPTHFTKHPAAMDIF